MYNLYNFFCAILSSDDCHSGEREGGARDQHRVDQRRRRRRWRRRRRRRCPVQHDGHRGIVGRLHDRVRADGVPDAFQVLYVNTRGTAVE